MQIHQIMDSNNSNAEQAKAVKSEGSTLITLKDGTSLHNSDRNSLYLSVIIEISNSQTKKNFAYLADQYIVETSGCVEIVIGIKLDNRRLLKAEVSLWRPQIVGESGQRYLRSNQEISSEVREVKSLCLCVTDESRFFVGKTVPQVGGKSLVLQIKDLYIYTQSRPLDCRRYRVTCSYWNGDL